MELPVYLDHHATTPVDPRVLEAMLPFFSRDFGNAASSQHVFGWKAAAAVNAARELLAAALGGQASEIVFTSGATEADNLAVLGAARLLAGKGRHVVATAVEHRAVLDPCRALTREGFEVTLVAPDAEGRVSVEAVAEALRPETVLISVMAASNEIGALYPVGAIGALAKARGILVHSDAVQAFGKVPLDVERAGLDLVSVSAHKIHGPKGVGALWVRSRGPHVRLAPLQLGGGHERGRRSGTLDVPGIVGLGEAARIAVAVREEEAARLSTLRDVLHERLRARVPGLALNGPPADRLPGSLNVRFPGVEADALMAAVRDVAVSSGAACSSASGEPSHVLAALGLTPAEVRSSIRFGLGRGTTLEEVEYAADRFSRAWVELRARAPGPRPRLR